MAKECLYERESTSLQREYMWGEHVCMFDRIRREREGQSHGGTARSRPRLSSADCLDWLKKTNPSGQAVGWRQALLGPPPLLLLNIKLFQMIYGRSPLGDSVLFTFLLDRELADGGGVGVSAQSTWTREANMTIWHARPALSAAYIHFLHRMPCALILLACWLPASDEGVSVHRLHSWNKQHYFRPAVAWQLLLTLHFLWPHTQDSSYSPLKTLRSHPLYFQVNLSVKKPATHTWWECVVVFSFQLNLVPGNKPLWS